MIWNHRLLRIAVGLLLVGLVLVVLLPGLTGYTSLDGTVNARFAIVNAPIDGTIAQATPKVGTPLVEGKPLLLIHNERVNRSVLASLSAERKTALDRVTALRRERGELAQLRDELANRLNIYKEATIASIQQDLSILRKRVETSEAQNIAAQADLIRRRQLGSQGIVSNNIVELARAAEVMATGQVTISNMSVDQLEQKLEALRKGVFVAGDGQNDVPYSRQRQDEVIVRISDIDTRITENETRAAQIEKQMIEEENRVKNLETAIVPVPFDGVVWRSSVINGSNVILNNELMRILDCRELFVDILVPEIDYDEIFPGREAQIRLLGRGDVLKGTVLSVRGSAAVVEEDALAANLPATKERNARIRVGLSPSALNTDSANFCQVGRSVQVRFAKRNIQWTRWLESLWFSIS
jgi:multidrug resistance efflux pump